MRKFQIKWMPGVGSVEEKSLFRKKWNLQENAKMEHNTIASFLPPHWTIFELEAIV